MVLLTVLHLKNYLNDMKTLKESLLADIEDTIDKGTVYAETATAAQKELDELLSNYKITNGFGVAPTFYKIRANTKQHALAKYLYTECNDKVPHTSWDKIYTVELQIDVTAGYGVNMSKSHFLKVSIYKESNKLLHESIIPFKYPKYDKNNKLQFAVHGTSVKNLVEIVISNLKHLLSIDKIDNLAYLMKEGLSRKI